MSDRRRRILRPSGLGVFGLVVLLVVGAWWLFADRVVERSVESSGAHLVGARVDVAAADIRPTEGVVRLSGLAVTNPDQPMKNLFEATEIVADVMLEPLLERKVVLQQVQITGVRFNTDRETSGALQNPDPEAGALWREVNAWADAIQVPELSLDNLGGAVRTEAISADSLAAVEYALNTITRADSMRSDWEGRLQSIDPRPRIDSVVAVVERLEGFRLTPLNALQVPGLIRDGRSSLASLTSLQSEVAALDDAVRAGVGSVAPDSETLARLQAEDLEYARSLLDIPSLDAPSLSPSLFGGTAVGWLRPVLYWARAAERFLPPGLDPRNRPGPARARAEGTTYDFREGAEWPSFLLQEGDLSLEIEGDGPAAGAYAAELRNLTSSPSLLAQPMELVLGRSGSGAESSAVSLGLLMDHTTDVLRDSLVLEMAGVELPALSLSVFGGDLDLGVGDQALSVSRVGDQIAVQLSWISDDLTWGGVSAARQEGGESPASSSAEIGSAEWGRDLVRRSIAGLERVELSMGLEGDITAPGLTIESNLGEAVAASLRREIGAEVEAAEQRVRAEVAALTEPRVAEVRSRVESLQTEVVDEISARRAEVDAMRERLQQRIDELIGAR
ncbi:MAG: hypothetical protein AAF389_15665 [Gemmatimonadota bacterium]